MDVRSPVNIVTRYELYPDVIDDFWFTESAWWVRMRDRIVPFTGGLFTKSVFRYRPLQGSFYKMGAVHDITKIKTLGESNFDIKYAQVSIPEFKEEIEVINKGPEMLFSLLDEDLSNGLSTLQDIIGFAAWGEGQTDDAVINGLAEMVGDGFLPSWNGFVATNYGGNTRSNFSQSQLNGNIFWAGNPDGSVGQINFPILEQAYRAACKGAKEPNLILVNKYAYSYCLNKLEAEYRFLEEAQDPYWGASGFKFHNAYVMIDEHLPSAYGLSDVNNFGLGNYQTAAFTNPITSNPSNIGNFPTTATATNITPGEIAYILNTDEMNFRVSDTPEYGFGFSGFMGAPDTEKVVGRIKVACNLEGIGSRYQSLIYGIGG